ncbi:MAG TPA: amidohydrolase family protein [Acidimicrobiia bacterium]|jgi:N-acyl-D-aspartate/D-glutamate deacylase|nr:amidohydrolase family protein [Acidimicrobiia bacterium]
MSTDIVIRGGTVVDGTGAPSQRADVAVSDGRITRIAPDLRGERELDADGCVVAPGFIDIHTHYDAQVFWDPALRPSSSLGVTTVVAGNCGFTIAPTRPDHHDVIVQTLENVEDMDAGSLTEGIVWDFRTYPEYLELVRSRGTVVNFTAYVGHSSVRLFVMGDDAYERAATADEIEHMCRLVTEAIEAGAAGFSTSFAYTHRGMDGKPVPSRFAERDEVEALFLAAGRTGKGVVLATAGEQCTYADMYELQPRIGRPFTYPLFALANDRHRPQLELHEEAVARGVQVWPQVTPRPLTMQFTMESPFSLNVSPVFGALMDADRAARLAAYADPEWRARAAADLAEQPMRPRWETCEVSETDRFPELQGRRVDELARERGVGPLDVICELALTEDLQTRFRIYIANDDDSRVRSLLTHPQVALGLSDAGAHVGQLCDAPLPLDFLGPWVRDRQVMPIERAVRKLTGEPADMFGFVDRGYVREGAWADLAVFDPATVAPGPIRRVRDFPADGERLTAEEPVGLRHVVVNGTPIRRDEVQLDASVRPGMRPELG